MPVLKKSSPKKAKKTKEKDVKGSDSKKSSSKTSSATKTATATSTKTSTDAYTQGNITVTGGAGKGATEVNIAIPGLAESKSKKTAKSKGKK